MTRCHCGYFHSVLGAEACQHGIPAHRVTHVPQTLAGQAVVAMVKHPADPSRGRPVVWNRAQCLAAGKAWIAAHPETVLYATHCKPRYGLPTTKIVYAFFGSIMGFREALGLPAVRQAPRRLTR